MASVHEINGLCEIGQGPAALDRADEPLPEGRRPEDWEQIKRGATTAGEEVGEDVEQTVLCPFCGSRVFGHDGDDLSNKLHDHIEDVHDLRPSRVVARLRL
jgi:hypothetical protein